MSTNSPAESSNNQPAGITSSKTAGARRIIVDEIGDECAREWNDALPHLPGATWYHRYEWRSVNEGALRHRCRFLVARDGGRIVGVLPLTLVASRLFGRFLCSMPFVNSGGPSGVDSVVTGMLLERAVEIARQEQARSLELRCIQPVDTELEVSLKKVGLFVSIDADPEANWSAYSSAHRRNIRRAAKNGLSVTAGGAELLPEFHEVISHSWRNLGTPLYAREYFESVVDRFRDQIRIFVCRRDGKAVGTALNGHFGDTVEGLWNGYTAEGRALQSNYVLYSEMIRDASIRGYRWYQLGRSTSGSSATDFKRKWNAEQRQLHWYYWLPDGAAMPDLNVENPKFRLAIALWRRMPLAMTRVLGPPIARCIP